MVEGDTGIGKTRLLRALTEQPEAKQIGADNCLQATAHWWSKDTPLHAFQPIFHRILQETVGSTQSDRDKKREAAKRRGGLTPGGSRIPGMYKRGQTTVVSKNDEFCI